MAAKRCQRVEGKNQRIWKEKVFEMEVSMLFALGMDAIILVSDNMYRMVTVI